MTNIEMFRQEAQKMIAEARDSVADLPNGLPDAAITPKQKELQTRHGTPKQFAEACIKAIGDISPAEAQAAVARYLNEWNAEL